MALQLLYPKNGGTTVLQSISNYMSNDTLQHPRRLESSTVVLYCSEYSSDIKQKNARTSVWCVVEWLALPLYWMKTWV